MERKEHTFPSFSLSRIHPHIPQLSHPSIMSNGLFLSLFPPVETHEGSDPHYLPVICVYAQTLVSHINRNSIRHLPCACAHSLLPKAHCVGEKHCYYPGTMYIWSLYPIPLPWIDCWSALKIHHALNSAMKPVSPMQWREEMKRPGKTWKDAP